MTYDVESEKFEKAPRIMNRNLEFSVEIIKQNSQFDLQNLHVNCEVDFIILRSFQRNHGKLHPERSDNNNSNFESTEEYFQSQRKN